MLKKSNGKKVCEKSKQIAAKKESLSCILKDYTFVNRKIRSPTNARIYNYKENFPHKTDISRFVIIKLVNFSH